MDGIINVHKAGGLTSTDVVRWLRRKLGTKKIGHIGTLDPDAEGVLPVCVGKATRLAEYYTAQTKVYRTEMVLGITTDTQDASGQILRQNPTQVSREEAEAALHSFLGESRQLPPMYSAVRKKGRRLYEYARQGLEVERDSRAITLYALEIREWRQGEYPRAVFDVECSKGTYIRTLCHDVGEKLGCGAHMAALIRLSTGNFTLADSVTLEEIEMKLAEQDFSFLWPLNRGLDLPVVKLPVERKTAFLQGLATSEKMLKFMQEPRGECPLQVYAEEEFLGIGILMEGCLHPEKVLATEK